MSSYSVWTKRFNLRKLSEFNFRVLDKLQGKISMNGQRNFIVWQIRHLATCQESKLQVRSLRSCVKDV